MKNLTAAEVASKWQRNATNAAADYAAGIAAVTDNPLAKAASAADTWVARVSSAEAKAKFERKLRAFPFDQWKSIAAQFGQTRYSQGVQNKASKFEQGIGPVLAYERAFIERLKAMPNATSGDRRQRMNAWFDYMSNYKGQA